MVQEVPQCEQSVKFTIGGSITVQLVSSFTSLDSTASRNTRNNTFSFLSDPVWLNWRPSSCTVILLVFYDDDVRIKLKKIKCWHVHLGGNYDHFYLGNNYEEDYIF